MATDTITNITQPAPIFEEGAKKYLSELTKQTDYTKALDTSKFAPGVAQQNALAQAAQQQAATQAGLGTLAFDPTTGAVTGTTGATGIGGYQQFLTPAAAQAGAAQTTLGNVRELEGAIISLIAQSSFNKAEITVELAKEVINKFVKNNRREVSIDYIQKVVSDYFQMDIQTLQSKTRKRHIVQARQIAMYFAKKFTKASLASIGTQIGRRDHATVLHACKTVDNLSFTDKQFRKYVEDLNQKLSN